MRSHVPEDITNKKFTITLPQLIMIISLLSSLIGFYFYAKTTIQNLQQSVDASNTAYKDVKSEVKLLREQMYDMAFLYNKNIMNEGEVTHIRERRSFSRGGVKRVGAIRDTIDLSHLRMIKK
jgi:hypothetical protein